MEAKKKYMFYLGAGATSPFLCAGGKQVNTLRLTQELLSEDAWKRIFAEIEAIKHLRDADYWKHNFNLMHVDVVQLIKAISEKNKYILPKEIAAMRGTEDIPVCGVGFNFEHIIYFLDKICAFLDDGTKADLDTLFYDKRWMNGCYNKGWLYNLLCFFRIVRPEYRQHKKGWFKVPTLARELIIRYILDIWANIPDKDKNRLIESNKEFIKNCMSVADVDIYTLNYDPVIYKAVKELGVDTGFLINDTEGIPKFSGVDYLKATNALSFLHGFVGLFPRSDGKQVVLKEDYSGVAQQRLQALFIDGELGYDFKTWTQTRKAYCRDTVIVTGLDKYAAFYSIPFSTYLYRFSESVKNSDVIVIVGASLDDEHINLFLNNALFSGSKKVVCVNYISDAGMGTSWTDVFGRIDSLTSKFEFLFPQSPVLTCPLDALSTGVLKRSYEQKYESLKNDGYCEVKKNLLFYRKGTEEFLKDGESIITRWLV
jgi:hypothetical protein